MRCAQSSYRDRTQEFQGIADRLKKTVSNAPSSTSSSSRSQLDGSRSAVSIQSEFNKRASKIGFGIHQTSQKLAKLAKLAKRTSVFDDPTVEIQELTAVIKQDITALNSAVVDLQLLCNSQGEIGSTSSDTTTHSTTVVDNLKNRLMTATKEFKEVLTMRTENLKTHENRRQLFSASSSKESTNPFVRQRPLANRSAADGSAAPPPPWANGSSTSSSLFPRKQADGESQPLLQQQSQQQQQQMVPLQDSYMQSRAEALQNVESTIHELGNIFTQLATMVSQQGELAIRCGGFSIGIRICHCLCDGVGAMQFLGAWAATAKAGALVATPAPCWDREFFTPRDTPCISFPHSEFMSIQDTSTLTMSLWKDKPVQLCFRVKREFQCKLKELAQKEGTDVCSGFDALAGHIWRSWVKALDVKPLEFELRLTFAVNMRRMLKNPPLKDGFYGNAISVACVRSTVEDLISKPLSWTARSVHRTRMGITEEYLRSTVDYIEHKRPKLLEFGGKLTITQWTRFSMYESADFGQGKPAYVGPIDLTPTPQVCVCVPEGKADLDANILVCICLPEWATHKFKKLFCLMEN